MIVPIHNVAAAAFILSAVGLAGPVHSDEASARRALSAAFSSSDSKDSVAAYKAVSESIRDPGFPALEPSAQHAALALAYVLAYDAKDFEEAHEFATRATESAQQSSKDWEYRWYAAAETKNYRDEADSILAILSRGEVLYLDQRSDAVRRAYVDTKSSELSEVRGQMLLALFERGWRPADGSSASRLWRALSLWLLEGHQEGKAQEVAPLIDESLDVIALRSDGRYQPLLSSRYLQSNPHKAARARAEVLSRLSAEHPRSLAVLLLLMRERQSLQEDNEVLALATAADKRIADSPASAPPYDDVKRNHRWILNAKANALANLGRFEEAVAEFRRAANLATEGDTVSQAINLAWLLSKLDRPEDALAALPKTDAASDYGKMQIALVQVAVMMEQGNPTAARVYLQYMRDHQEDAVSTFQHALLIAGEYDEAKTLLLSRISTPEKREEALLELQTFSERKLPTRANEWRADFDRLKSEPSIREAAGRVGTLGRYTWRYGPDW
jgi:tetratricopeptide (TPR) repeat protein